MSGLLFKAGDSVICTVGMRLNLIGVVEKATPDRNYPYSVRFADGTAEYAENELKPGNGLRPRHYVYNTLGAKPFVAHRTEAEAVTEAERLAKQHQGQEFIVLTAVKSVKVEVPQPVVKELPR